MTTRLEGMANMTPNEVVVAMETVGRQFVGSFVGHPKAWEGYRHEMDAVRSEVQLLGERVMGPENMLSRVADAQVSQGQEIAKLGEHMGRMAAGGGGVPVSSPDLPEEMPTRWTEKLGAQFRAVVGEWLRKEGVVLPQETWELRQKIAVMEAKFDATPPPLPAGENGGRSSGERGRNERWQA